MHGHKSTVQQGFKRRTSIMATPLNATGVCTKGVTSHKIWIDHWFKKQQSTDLYGILLIINKL